MSLRAARAVALVLLVALCGGANAATPGARIAFTQIDGNRAVIALYDADGKNGVAIAIGDSPSWAPDGSRLVFASRADVAQPEEVAVVAADGSGFRRLTTDAGPDVSNSSPIWSPRGDQVAFFKTTRGTGTREVWLVSPTDGQTRQLTSDAGQKLGLSWSLDGSRLLWVRDGAIYVSTAGAAPRRLTPAGSFDRDPVWSPDGSLIALTSGQLFVMNADGSGRHAVTTLLGQQPSWSPDGRRLAFTGTRLFPEYGSRYGPATRTDLFTVALDGTDLRRLTGPPTDDVLFGYFAGDTPMWWPDASRLLFVAARKLNEPTIYQVNADGTCEGLFAPDAPRLSRPAWRPGSQPGLGPIRCVDLRVLASTENDLAAPGKPATLRFTIDNDGNETATGVKVNVTPRQDQATLTRVGSCTIPVCSLPPIRPHGSTTVSVGVSSRSLGAVFTDVTVTAAEHESDPGTNSTSINVIVIDCTEVGTYGADVLYGTKGRDKLCARPGADRLYGLAGDDYLDAGNGDDRVYPGPGRDTIFARGGDDIVYARDGERDTIDCGSEKDIAVVDRLDTVRGCEVVARSRH